MIQEYETRVKLWDTSALLGLRGHELSNLWKSPRNGRVRTAD